MPEGVSSARPARLVRFGETTSAMDEGLRTRFGRLDEALAAYRATCEPAYRLVPTTDTAEVLGAWSGALADLGGWVRAVGEAFVATQAVNLYMGGGGPTDPEEVFTLADADIVAQLDEEYQDDPFLGMPAGGWQLDDLDVAIDDPEAFADFLEELGLTVGVADAMVDCFNDLLASIPASVTVTITITDGHVLFTADGRVVARITQAEATARLLFRGQAPSDLLTAGRWLGRVGGAIDFATGAYSQWQADAGMPTGERILRAGTEGLGVLGGGLAGGWVGGLAGGAAAGLVCGPGAPVCSTVLGVGGAILGAVGGSAAGGWLVDHLFPWMDDPPEPLPGEYDLGVLEEELAQTDDQLSDEFAPVDAATSLVAHDLAMAETADRPDVQAELDSVMPDPDELERIAQGLPDPEEIPPTGTTTTTTTTTTTPTPTPPPPEPAPAPAPTPAPTPGPAPPTGTTVPDE